jgi:hypothetical protein
VSRPDKHPLEAPGNLQLHTLETAFYLPDIQEFCSCCS